MDMLSCVAFIGRRLGSLRGSIQLYPLRMRTICASSLSIATARCFRRRRARSRRSACMRTQPLNETGNGSGLPAKYAFRLSRIIAVAAVRDSGARPATCGVTTTLSHCSSSGSSGGTLGSPSRTSRPAPAMRCARSAAIRACVSTTVPRPTLTRGSCWIPGSWMCRGRPISL